mmetsp:Transcript_41717/g.111225  ORF Transcript_41717/g.111225 Transcript_41717/m.111225 type:complete len:245 (-) Transcript_41717:209-943(-)
MALKSFGSCTLNDNWFEERAPPLNGVIADYGHRIESKGTASSRAGVSKAERMKSTVDGRKGALLMAREENFLESTKPRETMRTTSTFKSILPSSDEAVVDMMTTNMNSFGSATTGPDDDELLRKTGVAVLPDGSKPWARGRGGHRVEKGLRTSGVLGEVYKRNSDPQGDTCAQRSWLYYEDPMLKYRKDGQASTAPISNDHDRPAYDPNVVHARDSAISCLADVNKPPTHQMGPFKDWTPPAKE